MKLTVVDHTPSNYPLHIFINTAYTTMATPSFNKLSPSNNILNLDGVPNSLSNDTTATGSVDETTAENINKAAHENSSPYYNTVCIIKALNTTAITTPGPANIKIYPNYFLKINGSILNADSNIITGRNISTIA